MRILFFNYEYPPLGAGAANATFCIFQQFSKIPDLKVDLVTSSPDNKYHFETLGGNITIHKLPIGKDRNNFHHQSNVDLLTYSFKAYLFANKLIKKNKYDLSHSFFSVPCGFLSMIFKWRRGIPYMVSLRGADVPGYSERFSNLYNLLTPVIKLVWKNAAFVIANSQGLRELALKSNPSQEIKIIFNGIDTDRFKPNGKNGNNQEFVITPGGSRITSRKGIYYLIEAVHELLPKYKNLSLKILGEGSQKNRLEKFTQDLKIGRSVKFLGRIPYEKVHRYYQEAQVFVLPSLNEGMSNAMLEALATGLPILATDTGGTRELLKEGVNGFVIKMKNSHDIALKLEKLIMDKSLRVKMAEESRIMAMEYEWKKIAEQYFSLYQQSITKNKK